MHRKNKYGAKRTTIDGIAFDSKAEAEYYCELLLQEKAGLIKLVELQPKIYLTDAKILYKADFLIEEPGKLVWIDVKGHETPVFGIKKRLWKVYGPGVLRIIEKRGKRFQLKKEICQEP